MSQLTTNTTTIDELITMANNLPNAGSSGAAETCTVEITLNEVVQSTQYPFQYAYSCVSDGVITSGTQSGI